MMNEPLHTAEAIWPSALLVLPRLRVQNANAISSPMTWGFPAITAYLGFMQALERRLGAEAGIRLLSVGVVCHSFDPQISTEGYTRSFRLTRNPVDHKGDTAAIVEEGRVHLEVTLVFNAEISAEHLGAEARRALAQRVANVAAGMRLAGGSVMPALDLPGARTQSASITKLPDDAAEQAQLFRSLARRWLPGFALVSRDDLLQTQLHALRRTEPQASVLDAWLSLSRWTHRAYRPADEVRDDADDSAEWQVDKRQGWTVPIPVGYAALSELQPAGSVANARDNRTPLRFVESVYGMGQWISPHRLRTLRDLVWRDTAEQGLYRCINDYKGPAQNPAQPIESAASANR